LPDEVIEATPEIPWKQVKGMRIIAEIARLPGHMAIRDSKTPAAGR
jgi:hypothetical protein